MGGMNSQVADSNKSQKKKKKKQSEIERGIQGGREEKYK
jgi:hypothetical protein